MAAKTKYEQKVEETLDEYLEQEELSPELRDEIKMLQDEGNTQDAVERLLRARRE